MWSHSHNSFSRKCIEPRNVIVSNVWENHPSLKSHLGSSSSYLTFSRNRFLNNFVLNLKTICLLMSCFSWFALTQNPYSCCLFNSMLGANLNLKKPFLSCFCVCLAYIAFVLVFCKSWFCVFGSHHHHHHSHHCHHHNDSHHQLHPHHGHLYLYLHLKCSVRVLA